MNSISGRFKELRTSLQLTQMEFGDRILVSRSYISRVESGKEEPSEVLIKLTALEFDISYQWLKSGEGSMDVNINNDRMDRGHTEYYINLALKDLDGIKSYLENYKGHSAIDLSVIIRLTGVILKTKMESEAQEKLLMSIFAGLIIEIENKISWCKKANIHDENEIFEVVKLLKNMNEFRSFFDDMSDVFFYYNKTLN